MRNKAIVACLLITAGGPVFAQTTSNRPPSFGAAARQSGEGSSRRFSVRASVDATYDTNIFGIGEGLRPGRDLSDYSIAPTLQIDLAQPIGRQTAFIGGTVGYEFFARNNNFNRERIALQAGYDLRVLNSCGVNLSSTYNRARINAGDVFAVSNDPQFGRTNVQEARSVGIRGNCERAIGISPSVGYTHYEQRNSQALFAANDADQDVYDASLGYQRPSLGRIALYGTYSTASYIRRNRIGFLAAPGDPRDGVENYTAGLRFERNIGSRASGAIAVGYSWVNPKSFFSDKFRGSSYSLTLALRPSERLTVDVAASRSADLSNSAFATYSLTDVYSLNGTFRVDRKLAFNFGSSYQSRDFRGNVLTPGGLQFVQSDDFIRAYGGAVYNLNDRLRLNALVSQQRRNSNFNLFDYSNTTVSIGASLALSQ